MNRLASFYAVSEEIMAAQEPPTFEPMPDVGVPKPQLSYKTPVITGDEVQGNGGLGTVRESVVAGQDSSNTASSHSHPVGTTAPLKQVDDSPVTSDGNVGTKIDSVGTLSPQEAARPATNSVPTVTSSGGVNGGTAFPVATGPVSPVLGGQTGRASGFRGTNGPRPPISAQGQAGTSGGTAAGRGSTSPMGRVAAPGQSGVRGGGVPAGGSPMGRAVSGGTPRPIGGTANSRTDGTGSTGAARGNGVVGGRPTSGPTPRSTSSRVPRGTVVGSEGNTGFRTPASQIGQRGVIGAPTNTSDARPGQTARPAASNSDGIVGTPKGRARAGRNGLGGGSAGVQQGPIVNLRNNRRDDREEDPQPGTQRRNAPPAAD
jgi:hypothetical protein